MESFEWLCSLLPAEVYWGDPITTDIVWHIVLAERDRCAKTDTKAEIERLRALLARYRDETPLGHQPHMIAQLADEALGRVPNKQ